jgi:photosystem I subunit XI
MEAVQSNVDPQVGNLATPVNSSGLTTAYIRNLPAYRKGISASRRGLEIGMAHGYLLFGPFTLLGPLRDSAKWSNIAGLVSSAGLVVILTICLLMYSSVASAKPIATLTTPNPPEDLGSKQGWSEFARAFLIGGLGGSAFAYFLYQTPLKNIGDGFLNQIWPF